MRAVRILASSVMIILLISCSTKADEGRYRIPNADPMDYEPGKSFADIYPDYVRAFNLTTNEIIVVGDWLRESYEEGYIADYLLAPNHYAFMSVGIKTKIDDKVLGVMEGLWEIKNGRLFITIFVLGFQTESHFVISNYPDFVEPYNTYIISVKDIHKDGYSLIPFKQISLPKNIENMLLKEPNYKSNYMYRSQRSVNGLDGSYRYEFDNVEFLAKYYPDARQIFTSQAAYYEYKEKSLAIGNKK